MEMVNDTEAPTTPTGLMVTSETSSSVSLSWTRSTDNIVVSGYKILRDGNVVGETTDNTFTDEGLSSNTTYIYAVQAYDGNGNTSNLSDAVTVETDDSDSDGDGIPDSVEIAGIPIGYNGRYITTAYLDSNKKDTDGDGLDDGVELIKLKYYMYDSSADKWFYEAIDNPVLNIQGSFVCDGGINPDYETIFGPISIMDIEKYKTNTLVSDSYLSDFILYRDIIKNYENDLNSLEWTEQVEEYIIKIDMCIDTFEFASDIFIEHILADGSVEGRQWVVAYTDYFDTGVAIAVEGDVFTPSGLFPPEGIFGTKVHAAVEALFKLEYGSYAKTEFELPLGLRADCIYDDEIRAHVFEIKPITYCKQYNKYLYELANAKLELYKLMYALESETRPIVSGTLWNVNMRTVPVDNKRTVVLVQFYDLAYAYQPGMIYYFGVGQEDPNVEYDPVHQTITVGESEYVTIAENIAIGLACVLTATGIAIVIVGDDAIGNFADDSVGAAAIFELLKEASLRMATPIPVPAP